MRDFNIPWMETAERLIGTHEIPGNRSNPKILEWAEQVGGWVEDYYTDDDIPWCGLFVAHCMLDNNIPVTINNPLSAREWAKFGERITPCFGSIMVFSRNGGGHVGFYVSEDSYSYHILGGNQSNQVNVTKVSKERFLDSRCPTDFSFIMDKKRIVKRFDGTVSTDEA